MTQGPRRILFGVRGHERHQRERLHPDDVGIEDPAVAEADGFGLACEAYDAVDGEVGLDRDAEFHGVAPRELVSPRLVRAGCALCIESEINDKTDEETDKPRVVVQNAKLWDEEADERDARSRRQRDDGLPVEATLIFVDAVALVQIFAPVRFFCE